MGHVIRLTGDLHQQVQSLLPWYVNGTLAEDEAAAVEAHLLECAECRRDLLTEKALGSEVSLASMDVDQGWAAMRDRIEGAPRLPKALPPSENVIPLRRKSILRRSIPIGWAVAAQAAALVLVVAGMQLAQPGRAPVYHALGAAPVPAAGNVIVIFRPDATEQAMRAALGRTGASLVGGPTASDAYVLHVDAPNRAGALAALRSDSHVVLAEPIDGPAQP